MNLMRRIRDLPGVLVRDLPRYAGALRHSRSGRRAGADGWMSLCNRNERMRKAEDGPGYICEWPLGSALHAPGVLPVLGRKLMEAALREWPIRFAKRPRKNGATPQVSFVIAHSGEARIPQLQRTLASLFAQEDVACEFIVVDQSPVPLFGKLPEGIVYRHLDKSHVPAGWHKSWAFNVGAKIARADILVFHDGDICAPTAYASELVRFLANGQHGAASLQRLLFYLGAADTARVDAQERIPASATPDLVFQNWKGGTIAIRKDAFEAIGGFDEGFVDWGGEDDEFFDRCAEVGHCRAGYLPFVHLWHAPQTGRMAAGNANIARVLPSRLAIPKNLRVAELRGRAWGCTNGPDPRNRYG